ncbi:unnamed protein product [Ilex paraguariensis]|uniref:U3 small nucleolar RNA-associated protein 11 n=1 Tax=Ilex paraguariensis TaxID=185542 RepID=A0ABC8U481_9AQUA
MEVSGGRREREEERGTWKLKEKAAFRNPDEFYFKMVKTKTIGGIHRLESQANKYTPEELMLMKTQDIGYILQKVQTEKKKIERLTAMLHSLDNQPPNRHVHYAEDRYELLGLSLLAIKENEIIELGILVALLCPFTTTCDCL